MIRACVLLFVVVAIGICSDPVSSVSTRIWTAQINPNPPDQPSPPKGDATSYTLRYEISFVPDPNTDFEFYRITLEYTDLDGVAHKEIRTADRAEKITVVFLPRPFIFGTVKVAAFKETARASWPVWNEAIGVGR